MRCAHKKIGEVHYCGEFCFDVWQDQNANVYINLGDNEYDIYACLADLKESLDRGYKFVKS